jgi:hypothetical protein
MLAPGGEWDMTGNAWEARTDCPFSISDGNGGSLPAESPGISLSRKGILITAFGENPDGEGIILRLWEQAGISGELTVTFPFGAKYTTATPVTLRGEKCGEVIAIKDGSLSFTIKAYAPASFLLK